MRYPDFLKENGTIGFVAPSFGCKLQPYRAAFENACKKWKELGYQLDLGPNCFAGEGIGISNTPEKCAGELLEYYAKKENDCLISCGGGELMCEILEYVDFEALRQAKPKWYMGYSDNTNLTFLLLTLCHTAAVYGPCAGAFGMEPWHPALQDAMDLLTGKKQKVESYGSWEREGKKDEEHPYEPYYCTEPLKLRMYAPDKKGELKEERELFMQGRLIGGCMDCLVNLTGTKFDRVGDFLETYREDGFLWFLEACDLNVFSIRRAMWQMEQAGWFKYVKGFLIGRPLAGQELMGLDRYEAVLPIARKHCVPILMDADLGHLPPMMPIVTGSMGTVRAKDDHMELEMEYR